MFIKYMSEFFFYRDMHHFKVERFSERFGGRNLAARVVIFITSYNNKRQITTHTSYNKLALTS